MDDLLATAALLVKFPDAEVHRVSNVPEDITDAIVVDVGGKYDGKRFFDHHQDPQLPASIVLVLRDVFGIDVSDFPELQWISDWDTKGPIKTQRDWGIKLPEFNIDVIGNLMLEIFSDVEVLKPDDPLHNVLVRLGRKLLEMLEKQKELMERARMAEVREVKGLKVVILDDNVPISLVKRVHADVAIVVQPNQRVQGALSVTRVDDHPRVDFRRIRVPAHFVHPNGFMAVVDPENLDEALIQAIQ